MNLKQGDIDPVTGLVFWSKQKSCKNGLRWLTPEKFQEKKQKIAACRKTEKYKASQKIRRNTDEERAKRNDYAKIFRSSDAQKNKAKEYAKLRRQTNHLACLADRARARLNESIRIGGYSKRSKSNEIIGCSWNELSVYIESLFVEGMGWHNRHLWHVDHIIPLASAKNEEELLSLCHYKNLQPLWAKENQSKGAKLDLSVYLRRCIDELEKEMK